MVVFPFILEPVSILWYIEVFCNVDGGQETASIFSAACTFCFLVECTDF